MRYVMNPMRVTASNTTNTKGFLGNLNTYTLCSYFFQNYKTYLSRFFEKAVWHDFDSLAKKDPIRSRKTLME